ncbi:MAG: HlyD family type I secretion periplasmic adaptor subunit [Sulfurimonas sp.]|nr:HlyD family type I secretion periplasmic adaptor subunit [Sulfurimonas sp.]MDQ7059903.1 HlyD family type I secretion periplasmic adaptor subunit [Sulfurimonas sp.]
MSKDLKNNLSERDYEFMHSLSSAVLQSTPNKLRIVMYFWIFTITVLLTWSYFAEIDEIAKGQGEIVPSGSNQIVQNLEGGIIKEILVREGEIVEQGQLLVKIDNQKSTSSFSTNAIKADALEAKIIRLRAESSGRKFTPDKGMRERIPYIVANEESLYNTNKKQLLFQTKALEERLSQKRQELAEARSTKDSMKASLVFINKEVAMTKPMVIKGVRSRIDFLKLQREENEVKEKYDSARLSIPRLKSAIKEVQNTIKEVALTARSEAKLKLNETLSEFKGYKASSSALKDQVTRTLVTAPMKGIIQKMFIHTIGGVTRPGADILEIVPTDSALLVSVSIKPSDIAFIYFGQKAIVKFTAYDFAIYGGLEGKVVLISPDTTKDEEGNTTYKVRIKTNKNYLTRNAKRLKIIPGMTVSADIITGRKTILDYILKPILKTKQYTLSER